jgi:hypothetical protein
MNSILDCINGLGDWNDLKDVKKEIYSLDRENIDKYVKKNPHYTDTDNSSILLTSIQTQGGNLLQDHVYLVDMAGFDGCEANINSPTYKTIIERADLIIFVHSSNSAISKVSESFFKLLHAKNGSVPVCLVHNIFESAYWRSLQQREDDIKKQKDYAIKQIREEYKLLLEGENAFDLNLGKVDDYHKNNFDDKMGDDLKSESEKFSDMESKMYSLFSKREQIRLANSLSRTKLECKRLLDEISNLLIEYNDSKEQYEDINSQYNNLKKDDLKIDFISNDLPIVVEDYKQYVDREYQLSKLKYVNGAPSLSTNEARNIVNTFINNIRDRIISETNSKTVKQKIENIKFSDIIQEWVTEINNLTAQYSKDRVSFTCKADDLHVDFNPDIDVEKLIKKNYLSIRPHSIEKMNTYLKTIQDILCGNTTLGDSSYDGYLEYPFYPSVQSEVENVRDNLVKKIVSDINAEIDRLKDLARRTIIPNIVEFNEHYSLLKELDTKVNELNNRINE